MRVLDLFSGIGGFSLGLEQAGWSTVAFCEIDKFCRSVLRKHWPQTPIYEDIRDLTATRLRADGVGPIDVICGGFPCQDVSVAGKGAGLEGERSGLWREYARLVGELRPRFVLVENVGALRSRGLADVLGDLASFGYDAQWHAVPAAAVGAPHLRDRVWIVAEHADADSETRRCEARGAVGRDCGQAIRQGAQEPGRLGGPPADPNSGELRQQPERHQAGRIDLPAGGEAIARDDGAPRADPDADGSRRDIPEDPRADRIHARAGEAQEGRRTAGHQQPERMGSVPVGPFAAHTPGSGLPGLRGLFGRLAWQITAAAAPWERTLEPPLRGMDDGIPTGVDGRRWSRQDRQRLKALGNAVVPLIPFLIAQSLQGEPDEAQIGRTSWPTT